VTTKHRYGEMTWPEVPEAVRQQRAVVVPVGTIEDHGRHLPLDTDLLLVSEICDRACQRIPTEAVVVPPVGHGYSPHHSDFPGPTSVSATTLMDYVAEVCLSIAHHGFTHLVIVNGHSPNISVLDLAARKTALETGGKVLCAALSYWGLAKLRQEAGKVRESDAGGMAHACELETSLYLALKPELVDMSQAVNDRGFPTSASFGRDMFLRNPGGSQVSMMVYWSAVSETGVVGDAARATREKGERLLEAAIEGLIAFIREFRQVPVRPRVDHH